MKDIVKDIAIPLITLLISILALYFSAKSSEKAEQANKTANRISNGQLELSIAVMIRETEERVMDISIAISEYFKEELNSSEEKKLEILELAHEQAVEANLNAYEEACAKYIDDKVDKERFKRMYSTPVRRLVDSEELKEYFPAHNSAYRCILKVYKEWHDLEK